MKTNIIHVFIIHMRFHKFKKQVQHVYLLSCLWLLHCATTENIWVHGMHVTSKKLKSIKKWSVHTETCVLTFHQPPPPSSPGFWHQFCISLVDIVPGALSFPPPQEEGMLTPTLFWDASGVVDFGFFAWGLAWLCQVCIRVFGTMWEIPL